MPEAEPVTGAVPVLLPQATATKANEVIPAPIDARLSPLTVETLLFSAQ
jgi:hypothetical protein